ncbi:MAG: hypothetical protein IPL72_10055 [Sulfuritalea sp.]|nr:hypothetical protein [Sulfuritalea sp.]
MKRAKALARLNGRMLHTYSRRTTAALRAALPLRLALPHLEPVLALNVGKEVAKDTLVILRAGEAGNVEAPEREAILAQLMLATKEIDRQFLARVGNFPIEIVVRYDEIVPIRARRIKLLHDAALKVFAAGDGKLRLRGALQASYSRDEFAQLLYELFRLHAEETRSLSRSVRLPRPLVPLRELIAQELLNVMLRAAWSLAKEIAAASCPPPAPPGQTIPD